MSPDIIIAAATLVSALAAFVAAWRSGRKVEAKAAHTEEALTEIHVLVNSRLTEALKKIEAFENYLGLRPGEEPK